MRRRVTITFDNGPMPEVTPYVLDCLARNDVPATFFVVGRKASTPKGLPYFNERARKAIRSEITRSRTPRR